MRKNTYGFNIGKIVASTQQNEYRNIQNNPKEMNNIQTKTILL